MNDDTLLQSTNTVVAAAMKLPKDAAKTALQAQEEALRVTGTSLELEATGLETKRDALKALKKLIEDFEECKPVLKHYREELLTFRMATVSDVAMVTVALKDLRKFFLSDTHSEEVRRLKEFVELCERLKALKDSGFLDTVADTILKLDAK